MTGPWLVLRREGRLWWARGGGYTSSLSDAARFTEEGLHVVVSSHSVALLEEDVLGVARVPARELARLVEAAERREAAR